MTRRVETPLPGDRLGAPSDGARCAALFLHGIAPADRSFVMEALSAVERSSVEPLLRELESLGIPRTSGLAADLLSPPRQDAAAGKLPTRAATTTGARVESDLRERLSRRPASEWLAVLRDAPDALVVGVLRQAHARRRRRVLRGLDPARRHRIGVALAAPSTTTPGPTRRDQAVLQAMLEVIDANTGPTQSLPQRLCADMVRGWRHAVGRLRPASAVAGVR